MTFFFFSLFKEEKCSVMLPCSQCFAPFGEDGETEAVRLHTDGCSSIPSPHALADPQAGAVQFFLGAPRGCRLLCSPYLGQQN